MNKRMVVFAALIFVAVLFALGVGPALAASGYTLFGDASLVSPGNASATAVKLISECPSGYPTCFGDNSFTYSGIDFSITAGTAFSSLTNLGTDFNVTAGDCGGGSPRFQVNIGGKNVFVYIGPAPNFTSCGSGWQSTGNLLSSPDARFDLSQYGGPFYGTYSDAMGLLGSQNVTGIQLVADGGWAVTGNTQTVLVDNVNINGTIYTFEKPTATDADQCKKGGWQNVVRADGSSFKNQGDCVSYTKNGK